MTSYLSGCVRYKLSNCSRLHAIVHMQCYTYSRPTSCNLIWQADTWAYSPDHASRHYSSINQVQSRSFYTDRKLVSSIPTDGRLTCGGQLTAVWRKRKVCSQHIRQRHRMKVSSPLVWFVRQTNIIRAMTIGPIVRHLVTSGRNVICIDFMFVLASSKLHPYFWKANKLIVRQFAEIGIFTTMK